MVVDEKQVSHDVATCTLTMNRRFVPAETVNVGGNASAQISRLEAAFHKTYYEDPPGIDVTSVTVEVAWMADDVCTSNFGSNHDASTGYFEYTGWVQDYAHWSRASDCSGATTRIDAKYYNSTFCPALLGVLGPTTHIEYAPTLVKGLRNGQYYTEWAAYLWGGCKEMLTFGRTHGHQNYNDV